MRPIYHQDPQRVQAHIFVAALAFLLERFLEKKLVSAKLPFSSQEALTHLRTVQRRPRRTSGAPNTTGSLQESEQARQILFRPPKSAPRSLGKRKKEPPKPLHRDTLEKSH
jgi:hypothetical protein